MDIYACNVSNLTDARYFAALGAKWLDFSSKGANMNSTEFIAMKEWITGPSWVLTLDENDNNHQTEFIEETQIQYFSGSLSVAYQRNIQFMRCNCHEILSLPTFKLSRYEAWLIEGLVGISEEDIARLTTLSKLHSLYISIQDLENDQLIKIIELINPRGIILHGGEEEKIGYKSYDEIDDLIEMLIQAELH